MPESFEVSMAGDEKYYVPDPSYKEQAWTKDYAQAYKEFLTDKAGFWERPGPPSRMVQKVGQGPRMELSLCQVVRKRQAQYHLQLLGQACQQPPPEQSCTHLEGRGRGREDLHIQETLP